MEICIENFWASTKNKTFDTPLVEGIMLLLLFSIYDIHTYIIMHALYKIIKYLIFICIVLFSV